MFVTNLLKKRTPLARPLAVPGEVGETPSRITEGNHNSVGEEVPGFEPGVDEGSVTYQDGV